MWGRLPTEIWGEVFQLVSPADRMALPSVCHKFLNVSRTIQRELRLDMGTARLRCSLSLFPRLELLTLDLSPGSMDRFAQWCDLQVPTRPVAFVLRTLCMEGVLCLGRVWTILRKSPVGQLICSWEIVCREGVCGDHVEGGIEVPLEYVNTASLQHSRSRYRYTNRVNHLVMQKYRANNGLSRALKIGAYRSLTTLDLMTDTHATIDDVVATRMPSLNTLVLHSFVQRDDSEDVSFGNLPNLAKLVLVDCEVHGSIDWSSLAHLRNLQIRNCQNLYAVDLQEMFELCTFLLDAPYDPHDSPPMLSDAPEKSKLSRVFLRNVEVDVVQLQTWTAVQEIELVDCTYDSDVTDLYRVVLDTNPAATCTVGFANTGPTQDKLAFQLMSSLLDLSGIYGDRVIVDEYELHVLYGSHAFDDVRGVLCSKLIAPM